jgi:hypothetical protein
MPVARSGFYNMLTRYTRAPGMAPIKTGLTGH